MTTGRTYGPAEFILRPPELWRSAAKQGARLTHPGEFTDRDTMELCTVIPDMTLHRHVGRIVTSASGLHATVFTTSGQTIQFHEARPALNGEPASRAMVSISPRIDADGLSLVMSRYASHGFNLTPDQIPFGKSWTDESEKHRIRGLWREVQQRPSGPQQPFPGSLPRPRGSSPGPV